MRGWTAARGDLRPALAVIVFLLAPLAAQEAETPMRKLDYRLEFIPGGPRQLEMTLRLDGVPDRLTLALPRWRPGRYWPEPELAERIERVSAQDEKGNAFRVEKDGDRWNLFRPADAKSATVEYRVLFPDQRSQPRLGNLLRPRWALINPFETLLAPLGGKCGPCRMELKLSEEWAVHSPLAKERVLSAPSFSEFVDEVLYLGHCDIIELEGGKGQILIPPDEGVKPEAARTLAKMVEDLVAAQNEATRGLISGAELIVLIPGLRGSIAHRSSTVMGADTPKDDAVSAVLDFARCRFQRLLGKRLRPKALESFLSEEPIHCPDLWLIEGVSAWQGLRSAARAGLMTPHAARKRIAEWILERRNHRLAASSSVEESSRQAWERKSEGGAAVNYRVSGAVFGFALDILVRKRAKNDFGIEGIVARGLERFEDGLVDEGGLKKLFVEVGGQDVTRLFKDCIESPGIVPWETLLADAALHLDQVAWKVRDPGLRTHLEGRRLIVDDLPQGNPLAIAGLRGGDQLLRVMGKRVKTPMEVNRLIARTKPGMKLRLDIRRGADLKNYRHSLEADLALYLPVVADDQGVVRIDRIPPGGATKQLRQGDHLLKVGKRRVVRVGDVPAALRRAKGRTLQVTVQRGRRRQAFKLPLEKRTTWRGVLEHLPAAPPEAEAIHDSLFERRPEKK